MKKISSLFKRDYDGTGLVYDEVVPGSEWVLAGEGVATEKFDGTCCLLQDGKLYKRYDRKLTKAVQKKRKALTVYEKPSLDPVCDFKPAPKGWIACETSPNLHTGHWPGWLLVGDGPEDKWHRAGLEWLTQTETGRTIFGVGPRNGTYELVGPKVQANPYRIGSHQLWPHGSVVLSADPGGPAVVAAAPRSFGELRDWLASHVIEGIVWHHSDGRMVKIKRRDFGFAWPV
jgi:hypothetical protein